MMAATAEGVRRGERVEAQGPASGADRDAAEELLRTLFADPARAKVRAEAMLAATDDPVVASLARQVVGIVLRDRGETAASLVELRTAVRLARRSGDAERVADAQATLGASLATAGRTREGLVHLDRAAAGLRGVPLATVLVRRAWVSSVLLGRFDDSVVDLRRARRVFAGADDPVWEARALNLEGYARAGLGDLAGAGRAFERSAVLADRLGHGIDLAVTVHNRGWLAFLGGDLPLTFARYAEAAARFDALGMTSPELVVDRCYAYLAAGLADDAVTVVEDALASRPVQPRERADLLVAAAEAALAAADLPRAVAEADEAARMLRRQDRHVRRLRAELMAVWARAEAGLPPGPLLRRAERMVESSRTEQVPELPQALLLGARIALGVRSPRAAGLADAWLAEAAEHRHGATGTTRALGWLALALRRDHSGDAGGVLRACDRGLRALDEHQATLGSHELRALATGHGAELAALATRTALASGDARRLLRWSERWRATALALPPATQDHDAATTPDLAALRAQHRRLEEARAAGEPTERLERRVARLEQAVRHRLLAARGTGSARSSFSVDVLLDALTEDDTVLVELLEVDAHLYALVAARGRVRRLTVGPAGAAAQAVEFARFALRQAARGGRSRIDVAGARLQEALLGPAAGLLGADGRVVVSESSRLQGVPWGLLPALHGRPVTTTPSARLWLRARGSAAPVDGRRVMLVGPGLGTGGAEVPVVAAQDPGAQVLAGDDATVEAALAAFEGAGLAHVAAHGRFRQDSPLFSSLALADGPLVVHDLQRLRRTPHRVVLSACESGVMKPVGSHELLGLASALLSMGTAGVVSSLAEVDDVATVEVMVALHRSLRSGAGLGEALLAARLSGTGDPVLAATAASFTVLGT
jgi:CHAT domain-containing protein